MQLGEVKKYVLRKLKEDLPIHLLYHSIDHTKDVYACCKELAKAEKVKGDDLKLLLTAAILHDTGFIIHSKNHEQRSCTLAKKVLPEYGYTKEQIKKVCGMIMATQIPQSPKTHLEEIICDADLDYLGRDDFFQIGDRLYAEFMTLGTVKNEKEWNTLQLKFMQSHHYFTTTSQKLRKKKKEKNLQRVQAKLKKLR
ncbi:MAG: HD domain-containing protein [Bacteroidetes bacterium]|nr:HD domain-containing protein [Bacteroidota bacterium]